MTSALPSRQKWHIVLVLLAIASLAGHVVARTALPPLADAHGVYKSVGVVKVRQLLDRDAATILPAAPVVTVSEAPSFHPRAVTVEFQPHNLYLDDSLHNRPPPAV